MVVLRDAPPSQSRRNVPLWVGFLISLGAWAAQFQFVYAATPWACEHGGLPLLHTAAAVCLLLVLTGTFLSWRNYRSVGGDLSDKETGELARVRMLAALGTLAGVLFTFATIAQWIAIALLDPCATT